MTNTLLNNSIIKLSPRNITSPMDDIVVLSIIISKALCLLFTISLSKMPNKKGKMTKNNVNINANNLLDNSMLAK